MKKIIFITGTDTGVGKTFLTALLLRHLRERSVRALAMKPFCSGGLGDVRLIQSLQAGELSDAEMNPYYFSEPIAPLAAAKQGQRPLRLREVIQRIKAIEKKCDRLLIEGSGGLMVPLGKGFDVADLIAELHCHVIVVARDRLGTINHTLLTIRALQGCGIKAKDLKIVLMGEARADLSSRTNQQIISELVYPVGVWKIPNFGKGTFHQKTATKNFQKVKQTLEELEEWAV